MKNLGICKIRLDDILMTLNNERKTWSRDGLQKLVNSIKRRGQITPIILHQLAKKEEGKKNRMIAGNRRYISHKILKWDKIMARVYSGLSEDEMAEMHGIENATKRKIAASAHAHGYWDLYKLLVAEYVGLKGEDILTYNPKDYWSIEEFIRDKLTISSFAKIVGKSSATIRDAFLYIRVNKDLKKIVYSVALQFGKIPNKKEQIIIHKKACDAFGQKRLTGKRAKKYVNNYIRSQTKKNITELTSQKPKIRRKMNKYSNLNELISFKKKIKYVLSMNGGFISSDIKDRNGRDMTEIFSSVKTKVEKLVSIYCDNKKYREVEKEFIEKRKKKGLLESILSGDVELEDNENSRKREIGEIKYLPSVNLIDIVPCSNQVREDFDDENIRKMAKTIEKYGIMQPIMIRRKAEGYEIVVGENRYWAANVAGVKKIDALFVDVDDVTAHIIRAEEDLYEEVILSERAENLMEQYELRKKKYGPSYSLKDFSKEMSNLGMGALHDALKYASLDDETKALSDAGLINFSQGVVLSNIENLEIRRQYAATSIMLGLNAKKLNEQIYKDKYQLCLPNYDIHTNRIKGLHFKVVEKFGDLSFILNDKKFENMTDKGFYRKLYELNELIGEFK